MEDFVAYSSRARVAFLVLVCAGFVAVGLWLSGTFGEIPQSRRYSQNYGQVIGWLTVTFFGFVAVSLLPLLFKTSQQLHLSAAGLRWKEWSDDLIPWSEVAEVSTWSQYGQRSIVVHLKDRGRFPGRGPRALLNILNRRFSGGDLLISMNSTNRSFDETLAAIEHFRAGSN